MVFPGSFSLEAVETVAQLTVEMLDSLVSKSLLSVLRAPGRELRYRLLDTLRGFGRERLRAGAEELELSRRRRRWLGECDELAERLGDAELVPAPVTTWAPAPCFAGRPSRPNSGSSAAPGCSKGWGGPRRREGARHPRRRAVPRGQPQAALSC